MLEGLFQPAFVQIAGAVILVAALGQALFSVTGIVRRSHAQKEHLNDAREFLRSQTRAVLREAKRREDLLEHSWNGIRKFEVSHKVLEADGVHFSLAVGGEGLVFGVTFAGEIQEGDLLGKGFSAGAIAGFADQRV